MQVILLDKVTNLGGIGDIVNVKGGYARNFLIPQKKAVFATAENIAGVESRRAELEKSAADKLVAAQALARDVETLNINIERRAGEEGKLFGSVTSADVAEAIVAAGVSVAKSNIDMPEGTIRTAGEHTIRVVLHPEVLVELMIEVSAVS